MPREGLTHFFNTHNSPVLYMTLQQHPRGNLPALGLDQAVVLAATENASHKQRPLQY